MENVPAVSLGSLPSNPVDGSHAVDAQAAPDEWPLVARMLMNDEIEKMYQARPLSQGGLDAGVRLDQVLAGECRLLQGDGGYGAEKHSSYKIVSKKLVAKRKMKNQALHEALNPDPNMEPLRPTARGQRC